MEFEAAPRETKPMPTGVAAVVLPTTQKALLSKAHTPLMRPS